MKSITSETDTWRILVVDDDQDNLDVASQILTFAGAEVACASGGLAALEAVASFLPNLILLDLAMPGVDGWEVHRRLRAQTEYDRIPIVALTALAMPQDSDRVRDEGFSGHITKPFLVRSLLADIRRCIEVFLQSRRQDQPTSE